MQQDHGHTVSNSQQFQSLSLVQQQRLRLQQMQEQIEESSLSKQLSQQGYMHDPRLQLQGHHQAQVAQQARISGGQRSSNILQQLSGGAMQVSNQTSQQQIPELQQGEAQQVHNQPLSQPQPPQQHPVTMQRDGTTPSHPHTTGTPPAQQLQTLPVTSSAPVAGNETDKQKRAYTRKKCTVDKCTNLLLVHCEFHKCKACCTLANHPCRVHNAQVEGYTGGKSLKSFDREQRKKQQEMKAQQAGQKAASGWTYAGQPPKAPQPASQPAGTAARAEPQPPSPPPAPPEPDRLRDLREALSAHQQETDEVRLWRYSMFARHRQADMELCADAVDRYTFNSQMLLHLFRPLTENPVDELMQGELATAQRLHAAVNSLHATCRPWLSPPQPDIHTHTNSESLPANPLLQLAHGTAGIAPSGPTTEHPHEARLTDDFASGRPMHAPEAMSTLPDRGTETDTDKQRHQGMESEPHDSLVDASETGAHVSIPLGRQSAAGLLAASDAGPQHADDQPAVADAVAEPAAGTSTDQLSNALLSTERDTCSDARAGENLSDCVVSTGGQNQPAGGEVREAIADAEQKEEAEQHGMQPPPAKRLCVQVDVDADEARRVYAVHEAAGQHGVLVL